MYTLGIDIGSTTVKVAVLDKDNKILFSDYKRHFANIKETLKDLVQEAKDALGENEVNPCITGSGGLALAQLIGVPFTQEVVCVSEALQDYAPQTDVAIELGGERLGRGHDGVLEFLLVLGEPGTVVIEPDAPEYVDGLIGIASEHDAYSL